MELQEQQDRLAQVRQQLQNVQSQIATLQNTMQQLLIEQYTVQGRVEALTSKENGDGKSG